MNTKQASESFAQRLAVADSIMTFTRGGETEYQYNNTDPFKPFCEWLLPESYPPPSGGVPDEATLRDRLANVPGLLRQQFLLGQLSLYEYINVWGAVQETLDIPPMPGPWPTDNPLDPEQLTLGCSFLNGDSAVS